MRLILTYEHQSRLLKKTIPVMLGLLLTLSNLRAQTNTLDVVSWNIEWFGSSTEGPGDNNLQEQNVVKILRYLNADIYGLAEIVDVERLRRVTQSLGSNWSYIVSPYCSNNTTGTGEDWLQGQKLAYIYNKNIFTNVKTRGLLRTSTTAYTNFADGRFPFLLSADATVNGVTRNINFILIHGRSGATQSEYNSRKAAAHELKDSLDRFYPASANLLIGDFNDALDATICPNCGTDISSYDPIIKDSTDSDHYKSITLPIGELDNHVISDESFRMYVAGSAQLRKDVANQVSNFSSTTSDHYPVLSQYTLTSVVTSTPTPPAQDFQVNIFPNPFTKEVSISVGKHLKDVHIQVTDVAGRIMNTTRLTSLAAQSTTQLPLPNLPKGIYFVRIQTAQNLTIVKLVRQ